jgi:maleate isomerase
MPLTYQPDGWDATIRVGVLTPHADVGPESEFRAMAPPSVGIHAARVAFGAMGAGGVMDPTIPLAPVRAFAEPPYVDDAVALLAAAPIDAIAFGFTSSAYVVGADGEAAMLDRLQAIAGTIPVVATCAEVVTALGLLHTSTIALFDPPWFDAELSALGRAYYEAAGFNVASAGPCGLPSDQAQITPGGLADWVTGHTPDVADAVVIGGNGFRAVGAIDAVEAAIDRPVLTANQVLFWAALRATGKATDPISTYGRLFDLT